MAATCGKCKQTNASIEHVKACYQQAVQPVPAATDFKPMALTAEVPASKYALQNADGSWTLYEVQIGKKTSPKWSGYRFVSRLVGAPGDWRKFPVLRGARTEALEKIAADAKTAAADFGHQHGICGRCSSPLSDPESVALGLGPVCVQAF